MTRLTFVGDIALDKPLLKAAKERGKGEYDFSDVFHTEEVFRDSNLVIGNLETIFGGGCSYNNKPYHYNSPDSFCDAIKDAGITLVSTANNHCMDEGIEGIKRTLQQLDARGIEHTGTFADDKDERYLIKDIKGVKIAFYSLTYSVNVGMESLACGDLYQYINIIGYQGERLSWSKKVLRYVIKPRLKQIKRKIKKQSTISTYKDTLDEKKTNRKWMADIEQQIRKAKEQSDLLVVLLHIGGQFNTEPGEFSKYMMDWLCNHGADIIVGNHPHTIQRTENREGKIIAYSLGGYCMSASGEYVVHDCLPEYSLALHVDIDEKVKAFSHSFEVLKGVEDQKGYLSIQKAVADDPQVQIIKKRVNRIF